MPSLCRLLLQTTSNLLEFFAGESSHCLGANATLGNGTENQAGRRLVIRGLCDHDIIILTHNEIEAYQFSSCRSGSIVKRLQTFRSILDFLDSLFSEIDQADISWHKSSSHSAAN